MKGSFEFLPGALFRLFSDWLRMAVLWSLTVLMFGMGTGRAEPAGKPHLVIFLADDFSYLDSKMTGAGDVRTPHMERLAAAGMTFTHAFVASPSCAPSRAALLTGLMPARNGAEVNHARPRAELKKLPAFLKEQGYEVVAFGKVAHYKHTEDYGFDHFAFDGFHQHQAIPEALKWLRERKSEKPLCLFVGSNWPHVPWPQPAAWTDPAKAELPPSQADTPETRVARTAYATAIEHMDNELGRVLDTARETLGSHVVTLMTSDHGAQFPFAKWNCYDAGTRVPLLVSWPAVIAPGSQTGAMVSWVDILPTLVDLAGGPAPADLDGRSFAPVLRGKTTDHRDRIFTTHSADGKMNHYPMRSVRSRDWKLIHNLTPDAKFTTHIDLGAQEKNPGPTWGGYWNSWVQAAAAEPDSDAAAKVKRYHYRPAIELYDLTRDPHELHNLAQDSSQAKRVQELQAELETWRRTQGEQP